MIKGLFIGCWTLL